MLIAVWARKSVGLVVLGLLGFSGGAVLPAPAPAEAPWLYDPTVLRTIELTFANGSFLTDLERISSTTVDGHVVADLKVDGVVHPGVGVRFRGNTSQRNVGEKHSFKVAIDHSDPDLRVLGYRTLKLNNAASDPTFLREALFSQVCHQYFPSPTANHVVLVINGQNWGVYVNVQQFNKDFLDEWFDATTGNRFKAPSGTGTGPAGGVRPRCTVPGGMFACGDRALMWLGENLSEYQLRYELNSSDQTDPWGDLEQFCDDFNNTLAPDFESLLPSLLDVDGALWLIAMENVFGDHDGYISKGADYVIYQEPNGGRMHTIQHDANECFQATSWGVLESASNDQRPIVKRLLSIPHYRARYIAYFRTLLDEFFRWDVLGPLAAAQRDLIAPEVARDTRKIFSTALFEQNFESTVTLPAGGFGGGTLIGLREFVETRRAFLLGRPELMVVPPLITDLSVEVPEGAAVPPQSAVRVRVKVASAQPLEAVLLHHTGAIDAIFDSVPLVDDGAHGDDAALDGIWGGEIPGFPAGSLVRYYVEARGGTASAFAPARAERGSRSFRVDIPTAASTPVVINELMASNKATIADPQGEFDDWVELFNLTDATLDLAGMYLSDNEVNPRKWRLPAGAVLGPRGHIVVWLDEDSSVEIGLHASFKLDAAGETLELFDIDERSNQRLDSVTFGALTADVAWGRRTDGSATLEILAAPSPGWTNGETGAATFVRGDANRDGIVAITDAIYALRYLFQGGDEPSCEDAVDVNDDGVLNLSDPVSLLGSLFLGARVIASPYPMAGQDPTPDELAQCRG